MHQFKYEFVKPGIDGDERKIDLSPYIQKNADFIVFFGTSNRSPLAAGMSYVYAYIRSLDDVRQLNDGTVYDVNQLEDVFKTPNIDQTVTFDEETRILTIQAANSYEGFESSVLLFYAG